MGYSFVISTSIKLVKGLELILCVPFAFGCCCYEPTSCSQRSILWMAEIKINLYQNDGKKNVWRRLGTAYDPKHTISSVNMVEQCDGMSMNGFQWHWVTGFIDDMTEDRSSWMNSEVYRDLLSAQIQPNEAKLIGWRFIVQVDIDPKQTAKATQEVFEGKKVDYSAMAKPISLSQPDWICIHLMKTKLKAERPTNKQKTVGWSKVLAQHHKGRNPVFGDVHEFQT